MEYRLYAPFTKEAVKDLKVGDKVKVKILNTNDGKISLSIKAAAEEMPMTEEESKEAQMYSSGETIGTGLGELLKNLKLN